MKLCIELLERALSSFHRESGTLLILGPPEAYPEGIAYQIAISCLVRREIDRLSIITVYDDVEPAITLFRMAGIDLESLSRRGDAVLRQAETLEDIEMALLSLPNKSMAVIDATAGNPRGSSIEAFRRLFSYVRHDRSAFRVLLLANPQTWEEPPLARLSELADAIIRLNVAAQPGSSAVTRYLEVVYTRGFLTPYTRVYYTISDRGVEFTSMREV